MELVRGLNSVSKGLRGCALTVGNYDGVHLGHQQMIRALKRRAAETGVPSTVLVFEPSSKEFIDPDAAPARLTRWREKFAALAALEVDRLVTLPFNDCMRAMSPDDFVDQLIVRGLGACHVVVGDDFRYGSKACGTIDSLKAAGHSRGFEVEQIAPFVLDGVRVSSTVVRERLERGDYPGAARLLGRPYRMIGHVAHGRELGRTLRVSHRELASHAAQVPDLGRDRRAGAWHRGRSAGRRREPGHAADGERGRAAARGAYI